jgi:hypothetical protein
MNNEEPFSFFFIDWNLLAPDSLGNLMSIPDSEKPVLKLCCDLRYFCVECGYGIAYCRYHPSYNVAPGAHMPVVHYDSKDKASKEPVVHCMRWGLVPSFTKKTEKPDYYRMVRFHISNLEILHNSSRSRNEFTNGLTSFWDLCCRCFSFWIGKSLHC